MKIGVLLAGCGVYDGSEIHEAVFTLLAIAENGAQAVCFAPNKPQHHVVNHLNGQEQTPGRNVLEESARIARGEIRDLATVSVADFDALAIPGGFGAAKNLNQWALAGPDGDIDPQVRDLIRATVAAGKPIAALCMGPTVVSKALAGTAYSPLLTVGTVKEKSPYDIQAISDGMVSLGSRIEHHGVDGIAVDTQLKIVSAPCYMMEADIAEVRHNAKQAIDALVKLV
jgi:enhancing lycopene biosynthesis protein 2